MRCPSEADLREARRQALVDLMPAGLSAEHVAEWSRLAETLADDPPAWRPSPRYRDLLRELCIANCRLEAFRSILKTPNHEFVREKDAAGADRVKVHPMVALRDRELARKLELIGMLELSPGSKKVALF